MTISVVVCTYNRCQLLANALDSIAAQKLPESVSWEVIIVDNNSTDQTPQVARDYCGRAPGRFRYLHEPVQGVSFARNAGMREARGDIVAFTDDDVTLEPTWLENLTRHLQDDQWAGATGRILPKWPCTPPPWIPLSEWYGAAPLVIFDLGLSAGLLTEIPFGANIAFRKEVFQKYGGFRTDLGPQADLLNPQKGEDTEFGHRLMAAGEKLRYEPSAVVYHPVPHQRLRREYFLSWWFDKAHADVRIFGDSANSAWRCAGIPLSLFRELVVCCIRWFVTFGPSRRFARKLRVWFLAGQIQECYRQSHAGTASGGLSEP